MKLQSFTIELLSEGRFEIFRDGHINRFSKAEDSDNETAASQRGLSNIVGINPILVNTGSHNVLLDTGLGWGLDTGSDYGDVSNIKTNLEIFGLTTSDITHVILTHLHYDHAAGSSFTNADAKTEATFPNAMYFVHKKEWEYALTTLESNQPTTGARYRLDDFYRLVADHRLSFLTGSATQVLKGISVIHTGGHTRGHQIVHLQNYGESAYYLGDMLPSSSHLNHYAMSERDADPLQAKKRKIQLLRQACKTEGILLFYHSKYGQYGRLIEDRDKKYVLAEISKT